jgi:hypothetical protein
LGSENVKTTFQKEINRDIFGRQEQGGGLGKIWNGRKLKGEFLSRTTTNIILNVSQNVDDN